MRPLIPKGYFYDRFPTESNSAAEIHAREVESSKKVLQDEVVALETQAALVIQKHNNFFVPHFGLKVQQGIAKLYLQDESGNWKGVTGGAQANSIANEIMTYKSPAPTETKLTQVECVGLIINMIKRYELTYQLSQLRASLTAEDVKNFYKFEKRPTYQQYVSVLETMKSTLNIGDSFKLGNTTYNTDITSLLGWSVWQADFRPSDWVTNQSAPSGTWHYVYQRPHSSGFLINVKQVANFYQRAFKLGKPQSYWQLFSQYRIGIYNAPELNGRKGVALYRVDPFTGAPNKQVSQEDVVATGAATDADGALLSQVRATLFPEMYTLEAGVNYNVGDAKVRYASELKAALTLWDGISDKAKTPLVTIASQYGPTSSLAIYIQPTGIETALKRLTMGTDFQSWFDNMLGSKSQLANDLPKKMFTSQITDTEWAGYQTRMNQAIDLLHDALTHPYTYVAGIYSTVDSEATNDQAKADAQDILGRVGWPTNQPSKLFEVYVNDKRDANIVMNTVFNYLNEESLMAPPEMYFPESIRAKLEFNPYVPPRDPNVQSTDQASDAGKTYNYEIVQRVSRNITQNYSRVESVSDGKQYRRYFGAGKTIVSKVNVGSSATFLPEATQLIPVENTMSASNLARSSFGRLQPEERNLLLGGLAVVLIGGIAYMGTR